MATVEDVLERSKAFNRIYPKQPAKQLAWWVEVAGIDPDRILRLMEVPETDFRDPRAILWAGLVRKYRKSVPLILAYLQRLMPAVGYEWKGIAPWFADLKLSNTEALREGSESAKKYAIPHAEEFLRYQVLLGDARSFVSFIDYFSAPDSIFEPTGATRS